MRTEDGPSSGAKVCTGSVVVCVAITVVIGGSLEVAVWLLGLERVGIYSANFSSCNSLFFLLLGRDFDVNAFWMSFTFGFFLIALIRVVVTDAHILSYFSVFYTDCHDTTDRGLT